MVITVNDYRDIRNRWLQGESQRSIARNLGISRNTVKKYCEGATLPGIRKEYVRQASVLTPEVITFVERCLKEDADEALKKQCHTARRIFTRLVNESGFTGSEASIRRLVREMRGKIPEVFVPLEFDPGDAVQIDWGEATIYLRGGRRTVFLFCARLCHSDAPFVIAYRRQNSESFLDALVQTFEYYCGTPRRVIFDNAKVAVKDGFGANARATDSYATLAAHYGFEPVFCNVASGNEKGLVEGLVGFSRRNFCVPVPRVDSMDELNALLRKNCLEYLDHRVAGRESTVGDLLVAEKRFLYPLPAYRYDPAKRAEGKVSGYSTVRYDTNSYSVPIQYTGKTVAIRALPERIEIFHDGVMIAAHQRCFAREKSVYQLDHYLPLLEQKGRAIFQAKPVRDNVPGYFLEWLRSQEMKPKELVECLRMFLVYGADAVMQGKAATAAIPVPVIQDIVQVATVDLTAYDALCGVQGRATA